MAGKKEIKFLAEKTPENKDTIFVHIDEAPEGSGLKKVYTLTGDGPLNILFQRNDNSAFKKDVLKAISEGYNLKGVVEQVKPSGETVSFGYGIKSEDDVYTLTKASTNDFTMHAMERTSKNVVEKKLSKQDMEKYYSNKKR
jgi:hypothetical protein